MTHPSRLPVALAMLLVPVVGFAAAALPPCSNGGPGELVGCHHEVAADLTIPGGAKWTLKNSVIEFTGADAGLQVKGQLVLREGSQILVADGAGLAIQFLPGSTARLTDSSIIGHDAFTVATDTFQPSKPGEFRNVTLQDAQSAIGVDGVAATMERLTTRNVLDAVQAHGSGARVRVVDGSIEAQRDAVRAADGADVRFENTPWVGSIDVEDSAQFRASWPVTVHVATSDPGALRVAFRDAQGNLQIDKILDGTTQVFMLPGETHSASQIMMHSPYFVSLVQGQSATHAILAFDRLAGTHIAMQLDLEVPIDADAQAPRWPSQDPLRQTGSHIGYSRDGNVSLAWDHADDKNVDGITHVNRAVGHYRVFVDGSESAQTRAAAATLTELVPGSHAIHIDAVDLVGNARSSNTIDVFVDPTPPQVTITEDPDPSPRAAHAGPVTLQLDIEDLGAPAPSGLAWIRWNINGGPVTYTCGLAALPACTTQPPPISVTSPGNHTLHVAAQDKAGNLIEATHNVVIDTETPAFVAVLRPKAPHNGWFHSAPTLHANFTHAGPSGPGEIRWRLNDGEWNTFTDPEVLAVPGENTLTVEAADGAGNVARTQMRVAYDAYAPLLEVTADGARGTVPWFTGPVTVTASASDNASGIATVEYRHGSGAWHLYERPVHIDSSGVHNLTFRAIDRSGITTTSYQLVQLDADPPVPPRPVWSVLSDGTMRADWPISPAYDLVSGIASLRIERSDKTGNLLQTYNVPASASGHAIVGLPMADHRLRIVAMDAAGHENATSWEFVRGGNQAILDEGSPTKIRGVIQLAPAMGHDEIMEARFHVDGGLVASKGDAPFAFRWDTRGFDNGVHDIRIVAIDKTGLHHEEVRYYDLRNGYAAAIADGMWHAALSGASALAVIAVSVHGTRAWRQEALP